MALQLSGLTRKHYTRLHCYFRAPDGAASHADNVDLDLAALNLIERMERTGGVVYFRITTAGTVELAEEKAREIERRKPHHDLGGRLATWLRDQGRKTWENIEFRVERPDYGRQVVRPDVFSIRTSLTSKNSWPAVHEVKVSRADFLADLANEGKRAGYNVIAETFYYVAPEGMILVDDVPPGCGLLVEQSPGVFKELLKARRQRIQLAPEHYLNLIMKPGQAHPASWS